MVRKYKYLIFDVDDTLLDFYSAYLNAQKDIAEKLRVEDSEARLIYLKQWDI